MTDMITLSRAEVQQALEALKPISAYGRVGSRDVEQAAAQAAIAALRERLAQHEALDKLVAIDQELGMFEQPVQEPVGWRFRKATFFDRSAPWHFVESLGGTEGLQGLEPLYTTPQPRQWQGLTDEDRTEVFNSLPNALEGFLKLWGWLHFARAIEAKLREKNHG